MKNILFFPSPLLWYVKHYIFALGANHHDDDACCYHQSTGSRSEVAEASFAGIHIIVSPANKNFKSDRVVFDGFQCFFLLVQFIIQKYSMQKSISSHPFLSLSALPVAPLDESFLEGPRSSVCYLLSLIQQTQIKIMLTIFRERYRALIAVISKSLIHHIDGRPIIICQILFLISQKFIGKYISTQRQSN